MVIAARLRRSVDITAVQSSGAPGGGRLFSLRSLPSGEGYLRLAVSSQRSCGSAVQRNRLRRRLREAVRVDLRARQSMPATDLVVVARPGLAQATPELLRAAVTRELDRLVGVRR